MGILKRLSGWLLKQNSVPYNRLIKGHTVTNPTDFSDKAYVDSRDGVVTTDINTSIAGLMARMGVVVIPTNISLTSFPNPITVNGRSYTLVNKQRVLLTAQTTTSQNGIYEVSGADLVRVNDYLAGNGIVFVNTNQIAISRWSSTANALRLNGSNQLEVKVKNTGTDIFGGFGVDPTTGELFITNSALPGASGSLTIENFLGTVLGVASKQRFSNDFALTWDGANTRITVGINPDRRAFPQLGGYQTTFDNYATDYTTATAGYGFTQITSGFATISSGIESDLTKKCLSFAQYSVNPNSAIGGWAAIISTMQMWANNTFNHYYKARFHVSVLANSHVTIFAGYNTGYPFGNGPLNAINFRASSGVNGGNWQCICTKAGVSTTVNTALSAVFTTHRVFEIQVLLGVATFYIDNVLVATISTNLPNTLTDALFVSTGVAKTSTQVANPNDVMRIDYISYFYSIN